MKQETTKDNTKENLLELSLALFSQKGYDSVGVQEICTSTGITKPTLYYYFKSKRGLLEEILKSKGEILYQILASAAEYNHDFIKHLTDLLKAQLDFAKQNTNFFRFCISLANAPDENESSECFAPLNKRLDDLYINLFKKCTAEFGNMKGLEKLYAMNFKAIVNSTSMQFISGKLKVNDDTIYRIIRAFVYGVAN